MTDGRTLLLAPVPLFSLVHAFYDKLQKTLDSRTRRDILIVTGDFNAKIGNDNTGRERIMGREGLGTMNESGEMFADFCVFNDLVIGGSVVQHKDIHKGTWVSPDHRTVNQIDHITIDKKFRRSLQDTRVRREADVASDHHLLVGQVRLKLKKCPTRQQSGPKVQHHLPQRQRPEIHIQTYSVKSFSSTGKLRGRPSGDPVGVDKTSVEVNM